MRLTSLPLVLAGAGLAFQQVVASPLRVVVVTSHHEITSNVRVGSDAASVAAVAKPEMIPHFHPIPIDFNMNEANGAGRYGRRPCKMLKDKAIELSNKFRVTFGFAPIVTEPEPTNLIHTPGFRNGPVFRTSTGLPIDEAELAELNAIDVMKKGDHRAHRHHRHHLHRTFFGRVHGAILSLGPWEGRAVAFVLGCGLGVLFRMFWVMTILTFRLIRGGNSTRDVEHDLTQGDMYYEGIVVFESDAEELPPQYPDEKAVLVAADKAAADQN